MSVRQRVPSAVGTSSRWWAMTLRSPESTDIPNAAYANVVLYDTSGNILGEWQNQPVAASVENGVTRVSVTVSQSGLLVDRGKIVATLFDAGGNKISDLIGENVPFQKE